MDEFGILAAEELRRMCTSLRSAVTVAPGPVDPTVLEQLERGGFDQAPVDDGHLTIGVVQASYLRTLAQRGEPLSPSDPVLDDDDTWFTTGAYTHLDSLFERMEQRRAILVIQENDCSEYGHSETILGLLTLSDLNRRPLKVNLYSMMAHVEAKLAAIVEGAYPDGWTWISMLNENSQAILLGYWALSRYRGIDIGPVAAATLSQLIHVIAKSESLLKRLRFASRKQFENETSRIPELRNRVMHPVRPLVLDAKDVGAIRRAISSVQTLATRIAEFDSGAVAE